MSSVIENALLDHARVNLWANPMVDMQAIFGLTALTPLKGQYRKTSIGGVSLSFPTPDYYIAYTLTNVPTIWLKLFEEFNHRTWVPANTVMNTNDALLQFYTVKGLFVPTAQMYFLKQYNGTIILVIRYDNLLPDLSEGLYFRSYTNAVKAGGVDGITTVIGQSISEKLFSETERTRLIQQRDKWLANGATPDQLIYYVNGRYQYQLSLISVPLGSFVDIIWDSTIRTVVKTKIDEKRSFHSKLDKCIKYIVQRGKLAGRVDYFDDVDFYLCNKDDNSGVYYHRNVVSNVRQLTHSDYAFPVNIYTDYVVHDDNTLTSENTEVICVIRETVNIQTIPNVNCRLSTLYRLSVEDILLELSSTVGKLPEWQAPNLEQDPYLTVMRHLERNLPIETLFKAYGYHGVIESVLTPYKRLDGGYAETPIGYLGGFVAVYPEGGKLQVVEEPANTTELAVSLSNNSLVNYYHGKIITDDLNVGLCPTFNDTHGRVFNLFIRTKNTIDWIDVTGDEAYSRMDGDILELLVDQTTFNVSIRYDDEVLVTSGTYTPVTNKPTVVIPFNSDFNQWRHIDIWLGTRKLIPTIEFVYAKGVLYYTGTDLVIGTSVEFTVIASGLLPDGLTTNFDIEVGFVIDNNISHNNGRYLLDDKTIIVTVGGESLLKHECSWRELNNSIKHTNGEPYVIECRYPNLESSVDSKELMVSSIELDKRLKGYLDLKYPLTPSYSTDINGNPTGVASAFLALVYEKRHEVLFGLTGLVSMDILRSRLAQYVHLAEFDICNSKLDMRYVDVKANSLNGVVKTEVTEQEYDYLDKAQHEYLNGLVPLNKYFNIRSEV